MNPRDLPDAWREQLQALVNETPVEHVPEVVGELARAQARLAARLLETATNGRKAEASAIDRHLTAQEVAKLLGVGQKWCYEHRVDLGGVRLSNGCVRFPEKAVRRFLTARRL